MRPISRWQYQFLGLKNFPSSLGEHEIPAFFAFASEEIAEIKAKFKKKYWIAIAVQVGFIRMTGGTLEKLPRKLPRELLSALGDQFNIAPPEIASLRSIYRNLSTLFEHQPWCIEKAGFKRPNSKHRGHLVTHMIKESRYKADVDLLVESGKVWLYQRSLINEGETPIRKMARRAVSRSESGLYSLIMGSVTEAQLDMWEKRVLQTMPDLNITWMEWLSKPPRKRNIRAIKDRMDRIDFLKELKIDDFNLKGVALEKIHLYANEMRQLKPSKFIERKDPMRTILLACFLRHTLTETTDTTVAMCHRHVRDLVREAEKKAKDKEAEVAVGLRSLLNEIFHHVDNPDMSDDAFRTMVREIKNSDDKLPQHPNRSASARWELTEPNSPVRALLLQVQRLDLSYSIESPVPHTMQMVKGLYSRNVTALPVGAYVKAGSAWQSLIDGPDRERALRALEAKTLLAVRKGLRSGNIWIDSSGAFRNRDELLISREEWNRSRRRQYMDLGLPQNPQDFLEPLVKLLKQKLQMMAEAVDKGDLDIRDGVVRIQKVKAEHHPKSWTDARDNLSKLLPKAQLPDVMLQVDSRAGVTRALLNRPARSEKELMRVYAGMLAHATAMDATTLALMLPGVEPSEVQAGKLLFEEDAAVRAANDAVVAYHRKFPVTGIWGDGTLASSDMMSVDVSPRVWKARTDPRRNVASIGVYTHVLDQWIVFHDTPILLNERQAGAALEGVIRHREIPVDMLAVDTHGYTEFGMGQGALAKVALCPRIKDIKDRKIHCPSNIYVPAQLEEVCTREISMIAIRNYWDELVRIAGSVEKGQVSATIALARFGSAAQGDPVYRAGQSLGRLIRSIFLCDYFLNEQFRRVINRILAHGESIHNLQRAICTGSFSKPRGARDEDLIALSGSLTLLTNICLSWTTSCIQSAMDEQGGSLPEWLKIVSPARTAHINFRGTFSFAIDQYADLLIARGPRRRAMG